VAAIGPVSVCLPEQASGVGRALMNAAMGIAKQHNFDSVRLAQEAHNYASLSLYIKLGFEVNDQTTVFEGHINIPYAGSIRVRRMAERDVEACDALHKRVVGISRKNSISEEARDRNSRALVAFAENEEMVGFATGVSLANYCVTRDEESLHALCSAFSENFPNEVPIIKVTTRLYPKLAKKCVTEWGLKIQRNLTLMSFGKFVPLKVSEGIYVPSNSY
jgi:predicted N-acetyltransferase YhbS